MPRTATKLTQRDLSTLRREAEADPKFKSYIADGGQPGLYAWARRGKVGFYFVYEPPRGGARRRLLIDYYGAITLDQARTIALARRGQVAAGIDPAEALDAERRAATTVEVAAKGYLEDLRERAETGAKRGKRSSHAAAERLLERHVLPVLGKERLRDVTSEQVKRLHRSLSGTPVEANRMLGALSACFGWADRAELVPAGTNPTKYVERYEETGERRALSPDELEALGAVLHEAERDGAVALADAKGKTKRPKINPSAILAIRFLALTGCRRAELLGHAMKKRRGKSEGLRWGDVDLDRGLVRLDTKTGFQTRVLGAAAVELLRAAKPEGARETDCVCPGTDPDSPLVGIDKPRKFLWQAADLHDTDLHGLRHSFASIGAHVQNGRYVGMVSALLGHGHQKRTITERYITGDPEAQRPAADAIAGEIARLLGLGESGELLEFPGAGTRGRTQEGRAANAG